MGLNIGSNVAKLVSGAVFAIALVAGGAPLRAEPVTDRILSNYQIATKNGCVVLKINFNIRVRYVSHFPVEYGDQLRIMVRPIDPGHAAAEFLSTREAMRPPESKVAGLQSIEYDSRAAQGPVLTLAFQRPMAFEVSGGSDFQSIVVAIGDGRTGKVCKPDHQFRTGAAWETTVMPDEARPNETVVGRRMVTQPDLGTRSRETVIARTLPSAPAVMPPAVQRPVAPFVTETEEKKQDAVSASASDDARVAMKQHDYPRAIQLLTKALKSSENARSPETQELLGVAYQKNKQTAEARAVYEDYLHRYPTGAGAEGVRQRLDGIITAEMPKSERLRSAQEGGRDTTYWSVSGSVSSFYIRDDSFRVVRDPTQPLNLNLTADEQRVTRETQLSSLDATAAWGNSMYKSKFRFSGSEEHRFQTEEDLYSASALYFETTIREWGTTGRVGRQTLNSNGVTGRFDGGFASWQTSPWLRLQVVGGSPVASRRDMPWQDDRYFYGASANFGPFWGGFEASVFGIEQRSREYLDRQAVGTEIRYLDETKSAFLTVDYDVYFNELNAAIYNGTWTLPDKSIIRAGADYRKSPYLTSWNAIQGQVGVTSLYDLLKLRTQEEIRQMAIDRTATYQSVTAGYTRQITDKLQLNLDATAAHIDGTIASFNVDATPDTGDEFFYSAQLVGTNIITQDDLWTAGVRYSDLNDSDNYAVDLSTRYALTKDLRVAPRLSAGYRSGTKTDLAEYTLLPTLLVDYFLAKDLNFEVEVGNKWSWAT